MGAEQRVGREHDVRGDLDPAGELERLFGRERADLLERQPQRDA
jgi:hypothetical protein